MKTVIAVPYRGDGGRRDELWKFCRAWVERHHQWPIVAMDSGPGPFNRGRAINRAAKEAGDWDVLIVHDADNIADPSLLDEAVETAHRTQQVVMPYEVYVYLDEYSSDQLMAHDGNYTFLSPLIYGPKCCGQTDHWYNHSVLHHHHSGIQVFPRQAFESVGGFIEFNGWGYEDSVMADVLRAFTEGITWLRGSAIHLWHEHAYDKTLSRQNFDRWTRLHARLDPTRNTPRTMRTVLQREGHIIP